MLPENYKFSLFKLLFSAIIVVIQEERWYCPVLWNSELARVRNGALAGAGMKQVPADCLGLCLPRQMLSQHTELKSLMLSCWEIVCIWSQLSLFHPECGPFRYRLTCKALWVFWATAPTYNWVSKCTWTKALFPLFRPTRTLWKHLIEHSVSPTCTRMWRLEKLVDHQSCSHLCLFMKHFFSLIIHTHQFLAKFQTHWET